MGSALQTQHASASIRLMAGTRGEEDVPQAQKKNQNKYLDAIFSKTKMQNKKTRDE